MNKFITPVANKIIRTREDLTVVLYPINVLIGKKYIKLHLRKCATEFGFPI